MSPDTADTEQAQKTDPGLAEPLASIYAEFTRLLEEGPTPDVDAFCGEHPPEIRSELRALCRDAVFLRTHLPSTLDIEGVPRSVVKLGDFRLLQEIGRGGMGVVYLARQKSLDREVAVKVLLPHLTQTERQVKRFQHEARSAARLQHKNIAPIHAIGQDGETHYFAMEYVPGHSLAQELRNQHKRKPWEDGACLLPEYTSRHYITTVVELMAEVADAIGYGHSQGVVHRDIKPANILLDPTGRPHVVDFGLAKDESAETISRPGELAGTIQYMSPEQTLAKRVPIDHRTDVFSLGVVLYELLALERPFAGESNNDILYQISFREPRAIRKVNARVPRDLATICGKALAKSPDARYASAGELAEDLRRFLRHESILARPPSFLRRAGMFGRAHRMAVGIVLFTAIALASGWAWGRYDVWAFEHRHGVWMDQMRAAGHPELEPLSLSVPGTDGEISLRLIDLASGQPREPIVIGPAPLREYPIEVAGLYRVVVENDQGFLEATRHLVPGAGAETVDVVIRPTTEVTASGMVLFPATTFRFEHEKGCGTFEGEFEVEAFWIDEAEVSNGEYHAFVQDAGHRWPVYWDESSYDTAWANMPVVGVGWRDALAYAEWAGKRLPTNAEWERAGRGDEGRLYPWGDDPLAAEERGNLGGENPTTAEDRWQTYLVSARPVRTNPEARTPEGLYHMIGNVMEWTESVHYQEDEGNAITFPSMRVVRGGGWAQPRSHGHFAYHGWSPTTYAQNHYGFRCAKSANP